ncbi:FadR/GntR family transcriptional regulator [Paenibacillus radicis (ex Xue et al. 2023)]|uniref:FadR family transcriptional regulator n=1 Tax=Paenibacillus radicis (ex Xue et al. 2023) TaxID=2972489 RepID=A0ABT1YEH6_9BACL|nr:FadR/GntR family transcriptional regulator [Paenibacillus radicis (ex Xue et al. 2023)]MCR8631597.1 FadR family transcriptional regulator [Paenibacillus radicis (ex Xue et al. 2023)]
MKELVSTKVLNELTKRIEQEDWKPGQKLPSLAGLAKEYEVGVSTVREALRIMENRGYLIIEHGRGMYVRSRNYWNNHSSTELAQLPIGDLSSLLEFRGVLEPEMAALAAERGSPGQISAIKKAASVMIDDLEKGNDYFSADIAFHEYIAEACSNKVMANVMKGISDLLLESRRQTSRIPGSAEKASHFHMLIALAIEQRNASLAKEMMKAHLEDVKQDSMILKEI